MSSVKINKFGQFDFNPRGNLWLKDENRFGHKLLSKMGWSQGKGLGKNENGIAENLKVKMKSGNKGVGWSEKFPLEAEHKEYDAVLASLNEKFNSENKIKNGNDVKSLELRSQQFKKRLHYGKFVRGKDVCRYSEKDMNSIFVTKKPKSEPAPVKSTVTNIESPSNEGEASESSPIYKSHLSMKDYFEMKMKKKTGNNGGTLSNNGVTDIKNGKDTSLGKFSSKKNKNKKLDLQTPEESSTESIMSSSNDEIDIKTEDDTRQKEFSNKKKRKNKKMQLDLETSEELSSDGNMQSTTNVAAMKNEVTTKSNGEVSVRKKSKNKKPQVDLQSSGESSSDGHEMECVVKKETNNEESSVDEKASKKSKAKNLGKCNGLKLDPEIFVLSSDEEVPEKLSVKKEKSSRKRSKTNTAKNSKRIKLDPDLANGYSSVSTIIGEEPDIRELSACGNESSKTQITATNGLVSKVSKKLKKKKGLKRKRSVNDVIDISEESTSPESSEKELQEDLVLLGEFPQSDIQVLSKKAKKEKAVEKPKKSKSGALTKLKTCLKGSTNYWLEKKFKKVSFNEHVFYRTIKSDTEKTDDESELTNVSNMSVCKAADETVKESLNNGVNNAGSVDVKNGLSNGESSQSGDEKKPGELCTDESEEIPSCMKLPKVDKSNYNSWLENQRLATKMKLYQNMVKKIKKHPVLKTSNLLDLKGYGNWGF